MVFQIECSDEKGEHVELLADRTIRLFGKQTFDSANGFIIISERQTAIIKALVIAEAKLREDLR